jgi:hypothetical protein
MAWSVRAPEIEDNKSESLLGTGLRTAVRAGARIGETVAGLPGDIASFGLTAADYAGKGLGHLLGNEKLKQSDTSNIRQYLPTSENINKYVTKNVEKLLPEDYLTPQSENEEHLDAFTEAVTALLSGGYGKGASFLNRAAKSARLAGGAELAKWGTEKITGSPALGGVVKVGALVLGSLAGGRKQLENEAKDLYKQVENTVSDGKIRINVKNTAQQQAKKVIKSLGGVDSPSKSLVKKFGGDILNTISQNENMSLKDLVDADQVLNEILRTNYNTLAANKSSLKKLYDIKDGIEQAIKSTEKVYPEFYKSYTSAKDIWRGLNASDRIRSSLESVAKGEHFKSPITTYFILKNPSKLATYASAVPIASAVKAPYNFLKGIANSKYIRSHYGNMLKAASSGNMAVALKELHKVDDAFAEESGEEQGGWVQRSKSP